MRKRNRLIIRFAAAVVLICLPLAESLNSTELVAVVTAIVVSTLITELWAASCCYDSMWSRSTKCRYVGRCGKKDIQAVMQGDGFDIDTIKSKDAGGAIVQ